MSVFFLRVAMNRPTVNAPEAVQGVLEQYDVRPGLQVVTEDEAGTGVLTFVERDDMPDLGPSAVPADELPAVADDEELSDADYGQLLDAENKLHEERGEQGLTDLLLSLAAYLNSQLVIQVATWESDGSFFTAKEWTVRPGAEEVEVKEIKGMDGEHSVVASG